MKRWLIFVVVVATAGCALFNHGPKVTLRFHEQVDTGLPDTKVRNVEIPRSNLKIGVDPFPQLTERDIYEAKLQDTPGGQAVVIQFDAHGANTFSEMTTRMRGRYVVVFMNDKPIAAVLVEKRITNGEFLLEGDLTDDEERNLVDELNKYAKRWRDYGDTRMAP